MISVVADTHTLIWYIFDLQRLSSAALTALEQAVNTGNPIYRLRRVLGLKFSFLQQGESDRRG